MEPDKLQNLVMDNLKNNEEFVLNYDIVSMFKVSVSKNKFLEMGVNVENKGRYMIFKKVK